MDSKRIDIGKIEGNLLVFGGPYSNLEALIALREVAELQGFRPKNVICTGDVVAYCADPVACIELIKEWGIYCIAGNVELNLRDQSDECGCNFAEGSRCDLLSQQWYPYAKKSMTEESLKFIHSLPEFIDFEFAGKKAIVIHGSYHNTSEFIFASTEKEVKLKNFEDTGAEIILAGHCGIPFEQQIEDKMWINSGVIGMPANDGTPRTWYATVHNNGSSIKAKLHALEYQHSRASVKMIDQKLPKTYASTLNSGIWDNCEILPKQETSEQGQPLSFEG